MKACIVLVALWGSCAYGLSSVLTNQVDTCNLPEDLKTEIRGYKGVVDKIINEALNGAAKGQVYNELADFVDTFGSRIAGSTNLENAIDYMVNRSLKFGLDDVHTEAVTVPHWVRGREQATLLKPRKTNLNILGLGSSVGTTPSGITAQALVVESFDELEQKKDQAKGKIVVFAEKYVSYGVTVQYRDMAATKAAEAGGVASLLRSIAPYSIDSPHTGWQNYEKGVTKVPVAAISVEDAEMLLRMSKRGSEIVINLIMEDKTLNPAQSRNTVVEVTGSNDSNEFVLVSGHLDSWDVGSGAMDDGGGAFISWYSTVLLKKLNLRPKRTVRAVLWTGEEEGLIGAFAYQKAHSDKDMILLMESDEGTFEPQGITFKGTPKAQCIMEEILKLLPNELASLEISNDVGSDIMVWSQTNVPLAALKNKNDRYFWFHHSQGDRLTVEDSSTLDKCVALWTSVAYVVADLTDKLPKL